MANGAAGQPNWDRLLAIGIDYVRNNQPAWIFIAALVGLEVVTARVAYLTAAGLTVGLATVIASVVLSLMLTRHALTGQFALVSGDWLALAKLFGLCLAFAAMVFGALVVAGTMALGGPGVVTTFLLLAAAIAYVAARFAFYLPAIAAGHPTTLLQAVAQTRGLTGRILPVIWAPAVIVVAVRKLFVEVGAAPAGGLLSTVIVSAIAAAGLAVSLVAIADLYAFQVRSRAQPDGATV